MNAEIRPIRTAAETGLIDAFELARDRLPGGEAARTLRDDAFATIAARGLPNRRVEEWKYTDLRATMREARPLAGAPSLADVANAERLLPLSEVEVLRVVFVNGHFAPSLSALDAAPAGLSIVRLADSLNTDAATSLALDGAPADNALVALNAAFIADGLTITVAPGAMIATPVHVVNVQVGVAHASYGRLMVKVGAGASLTVIESHVGDTAEHQTNGVVSLDVADGAKVNFVTLQDEGLGTLHLATLSARIGARSELNTLTLSAGAATSRRQAFVAFQGERSNATLVGAGFAGARRHLDTTLVVEHAAAGCSSRETFKTALDGEARSVFQGKIVVRPGAQKTDGKMMAQALLLSEGSEADAKPELEIFADDVVCGHGATVGAIDDELLFYLMARGVPRPEAEALLVQAFIGEVFESVESETLRDALNARVERWLVARD